MRITQKLHDLSNLTYKWQILEKIVQKRNLVLKTCDLQGIHKTNFTSIMDCKITMLFYNPGFNQRTLLYEYVIIRDYIRDSEYLLISKIRRIINYSHYAINYSWGKARFAHNPQTCWSLKYVNGRFWKNCIEKKIGQWKHALGHIHKLLQSKNFTLRIRDIGDILYVTIDTW